MKRKLKIAGIIGGALFLLVAAIGVGAGIYLRTASGSAFVLNQARKRLLAMGIQLDYRVGTIDPFGRIHFENLKVSQKTEGTRMAADIKTIDIIYSFSWLARRFDLERVLIDEPTVIFHGGGAPAANAKAEPATKTAANADPVQSAREFVLSPPVKFHLGRFQLSHLNLDLDYTTGAAGLKAILKDLSASATLDLVAGHLATSGDFDWKGPSQISLRADSEDPAVGKTTSQVDLSPTASAKWEAEISSRDGKWVYELKPSTFRFDSPQFRLGQQTDASRTAIDISRLHLNSELKLVARTLTLFKLDPNSIETCSIRGAFETGASSAQMSHHVGEKAEIISGRIDSQKAEFDSQLGETLKLRADWKVPGLFSEAFLFLPTEVRAAFSADVPRNFSSLQAEAKLGLREPSGDIELGHLQSEMRAASGIVVKSQFEASPDLRLASLLKAGAILRRIGQLRLKGTAETKLNSDKLKSLADLANEPVASIPVVIDVEGDLTQEEKPRGSGALALFDPLHFQTHIQKEGGEIKAGGSAQTLSLTSQGNRLKGVQIQFETGIDSSRVDAKLSSNLQEVRSPLLKKPWSVGLTGNGGWEFGTKKGNLEAAVKIQGQDALHLKADGALAEHGGEFNLSSEATVGNYLEGLLSKKQLVQIGAWTARTDLKVTTKNPASPKASFVSAGKLELSGKTQITQLARPKGAYPIAMSEPLRISHEISLDQAKFAAALEGESPSVELPHVGLVRGLKFDLHASSPNLALAKDWDFSGEMSQNEIVLPAEIVGREVRVGGLGFKIQGSLRDENRFDLSELSASFAHSAFTMAAEASGKIKSKDLQMHGVAKVKLPSDFPVIAGNHLRGDMEFPWTVSIRRAHDLAFQGDLDIHDLHWSRGEMRVDGVSGQIPISEKIIISGPYLRFAHLITQNPFERVDYERLRPLINGSDQLRIEEIGFEEKVYGPFVGYFSMDQNMLSAHQFDMNLGKTGLINGELYFDVYPANLQLGFLSRLTNLNLVDILPKKFLVNVPKGDKNLSGRSGIVVNLNKASVDGRVDITEIGPAQLITMINVLDPKYENDKMNLMRTALGLGYPSFVGMFFHNGYVDMSTTLDVLGVNQSLNVPDIPITTYVASATSDIVKKTQGGPLQ